MTALRWFLRLIVAAVVVGGCFLLAGHFYLQSDQGLSQITGRLGEMLGVPVKIGGVNIGLHACTLDQVKLLAPNAPPSAEPWLAVQNIDVDIGYLDFASGGKNPEKLVLRGAALRLTFDVNDHLTTPFPKSKGGDGPMPPITIENGSVIIARHGKPDCAFNGINAVIKAETGKITLDGTANDPQWGGQWKTAGWFATTGGTGELAVSHPGARVVQSTLDKLPFVPPDVWRAVQCEGETPVDLKLRFGDKVRYRVALQPVKTKVRVASIDLEATDTRGQVLIEDALVQLRNVQGRFADGEIHITASDLDFRGASDEMAFDLAAYRLVLKKLPQSWRIPPRLGGKLTGKLALRVSVIRGIPIPIGQGEGRVDDAMLGVIPVPNYGLKVRADKNGFLFEPSLK